MGVSATGSISNNSAYGTSGADGNNTQVQAYLKQTLFSGALNDLNKGTASDTRLFSQVMGVGNDVIDVGAGNDWVMGALATTPSRAARAATPCVAEGAGLLLFALTTRQAIRISGLLSWTRAKASRSGD